MSLEATVFILRVVVALSLLGFLLALFAIIWRGMKQLDRQIWTARASYGYLTRLKPERQPPDSDQERHALLAVTTLGRAASNHIVVDDDFASAQHARIALLAGQWWLEDWGSRNGTRLNEATIDRRTILADGDVIKIGKASYQLKLED